jgi:uncharacterized protein (DUF934 family)
MADNAVLGRAGEVIAPGPTPLPLVAFLANPGTAVQIEATDAVGDLVGYLPDLALIEIVVPKYRDGRGFTQARALREHYGFTGDIRAAGAVIADQYHSLLRCGFSSVALAAGQDPAVWAHVLALRGGFDTQPVPERPLPLLRRLAAPFEV